MSDSTGRDFSAIASSDFVGTYANQFEEMLRLCSFVDLLYALNSCLFEMPLFGSNHSVMEASSCFAFPGSDTFYQ